MQKYIMTASINYLGDLRCSVTHIQSGTVIETDAPTDNRGKGEKFSPTDTLCVALGTCIITTMAIKAKDMNIDLKGATIEVTKYMKPDPRRVAQADVIIKFPQSSIANNEEKAFLENVGNNCPVAKSIHPDIVVNIRYDWDGG